MNIVADAQPLTPTQNKRSFIGIAVLSVIVIVSAGWLALQSKKVSELDQPQSPQQKLDLSSTRSERFRSDLWYLPNDDLLGFVEIPAGTFVMGSDPNVDSIAYENERWSSQQKQGEFTLPTYYMGRYEVTVAQYRAFVDDTGYRANDNALHRPLFHPVVYVSWTDALAYCRWLQQQLQYSDKIPATLAQLLGDGWRISLPSEAQWEKAARGTDGKIYPWGNTLESKYVNYRSAGTREVGSVDCPTCSYGLADMSGNVWEFTRSPYQPYPYTDADDSQHLAADALWVMRGGSFSDNENNIRAAVRGGIDPGVRNGNTGFRLVLEK